MVPQPQPFFYSRAIRILGIIQPNHLLHAILSCELHCWQRRTVTTLVPRFHGKWGLEISNIFWFCRHSGVCGNALIWLVKRMHKCESFPEFSAYINAFTKMQQSSLVPRWCCLKIRLATILLHHVFSVTFKTTCDRIGMVTLKWTIPEGDLL